MKNFVQNKKKVIFVTSIIILLLLVVIGSIGSLQTFSERDVSFAVLEWKNENKEGTIGEINKFCSDCKSKGNCNLKLYYSVEIPTIEEWNKWIFEREFHCVKIIDGVNYYDKEESYFGILGNGFSSFDYLDSTKSHEIEICCGVETYDIAQKLQVLIGTFKEESFFYHACHKKTVEPKC